ncbi:MAG TPA: hypothetical protein VGC96_09095 [Candidatus Elarobacter sp.]
MLLFPEREDRGVRRLLPAALILSLVVHLVATGTWLWFDRRVVPAIAKLFPEPAPEIVALSDAITIERRTVPPPARRAAPQPRRPAPPRRRIAQNTLLAPPVPTLPPVLATAVPSFAPAAEPTLPPRVASRRRPAAGTLATPREEPTPREVPTPPPSQNAFSEKQIAALDAQFAKTIAQAQHALVDVPPQRRPPARNPQSPRYEAVMAGTPEMFFGAFQGDCVPIQGPMRLGTQHAYYIRCMIRYSDGYFEQVSYPWIYRFAPNKDPFDERVNINGEMRFPPQGPSEGFVLPRHFALSRAICTFYRAQCEAIIARERANGNQPAPDAP